MSEIITKNPHGLVKNSQFTRVKEHFERTRKQRFSFLFSAPTIKDEKRSLNNQISFWLVVCTIMVWGMVILGGITRLTGSGLSIVKWQPIVGILPPLTRESWQQAFLAYQQFPEFQQINFDMTLVQFKFIYLMEWGHRLLGRLIGLALMVPTAMCILNLRLRFLWPRLTVLWGLGLSQGIMGWYMVKSGLVFDPWVSPYRLTAHLLLAFLILGVLIWTIADLKFPARKKKHNTFQPFSLLVGLVLGSICLTILMGGMTAGLKAGLIYNTFPRMEGYWIPPEILALQPWWINFLENAATVQLLHRGLALITCGLTVAMWINARKISLTFGGQLLLNLLALAVALQAVFGIATLLQHVPILLGVIHQSWAVVVFASALLLLHGICARSGAWAIQPPPNT